MQLEKLHVFLSEITSGMKWKGMGAERPTNKEIKRHLFSIKSFAVGSATKWGTSVPLMKSLPAGSRTQWGTRVPPFFFNPHASTFAKSLQSWAHSGKFDVCLVGKCTKLSVSETIRRKVPQPAAFVVVSSYIFCLISRSILIL